jgi:serine/threonine protein kinase
MNRTESFFKQRQVSADIRKRQLALHDCVTHLNLASQLELHRWTNELDVAFQKDQELLVNILQTQEEMLEIMKGLQLDLRKQPEDSEAHKASEAQLLGLHTRSGQRGLPICELRGECKKIGNPIGGSSAYDIYEGLWLGKQKVALKALRGVDPDQKKLRRFHRQVEIWSRLKSPYILTLYGARYDDGPSPYLVSPWLHNGNAVKYLQENPHADRVQIALEVAYGLQYLHSQDPAIVHGGLQGSSILISDSGCAVLADFGLSKAVEKLADTMYTASNGAGASFRWMAPELQSDGALLEPSCDVYSWAMTALQLITDKAPFYKIKSPGKVVIEVAKGKRPAPQDYPDCRYLNDPLWALFERCWQDDPSQRPTIDAVVNEMEIIISWLR